MLTNSKQIGSSKFNPRPLTAAEQAKPTLFTTYVDRGPDQQHNEDVDSGSDEERTNYNVISRLRKKCRKTTSTSSVCPFGSPSFQPLEKSKVNMIYGLENDVEDSGDKDEDSLISRRRKSITVPESDKIARQRCYEYIHTAIDAVWAEFCDSTAYAESLKYMPHSPVSEQEDVMFLSSGDEKAVVSRFTQELHEPSLAPTSSKGHQRTDSISMQPRSQSLMRQKKRLLEAKYYLSHLVSASDPHSSSLFWRVWDQLKYSTAELVEGDDEEAEEVIDDLEIGRFHSN